MDIVDFLQAVTNFDPTGKSGFVGWATGNFDGDSDIDISDIMQLVLKISSLGYPSANPGIANLAAVELDGRMTFQAAHAGQTTIALAVENSRDSGDAVGAYDDEQSETKVVSNSNQSETNNGDRSAGSSLQIDVYW